MIGGYLDRMLRPLRRPLVMQVHRVGEPAALRDVSIIMTTSQRLQPGDRERVRSLDTRKLVDGQIVKIPR
jgi:hypothetical protein